MIRFHLIWLIRANKRTTDRFRPGLAQECLEIAAGEQFEDDEARVFVETDANEVDDVGVVELGHDQRLHQKVHLCLVRRQLWQRLTKYRSFNLGCQQLHFFRQQSKFLSAFKRKSRS